MRAATAEQREVDPVGEMADEPRDRPRQRDVSGQGRLVRAPNSGRRRRSRRRPARARACATSVRGARTRRRRRRRALASTPGAGPSRRRDPSTPRLRRSRRWRRTPTAARRPRRTPAAPSPRPSRRRRRRAGARPPDGTARVSRSVARRIGRRVLPGRPPASARRAARRAAGAWVPPAPVPIRGGGEPRAGEWRIDVQDRRPAGEPLRDVLVGEAVAVPWRGGAEHHQVAPVARQAVGAPPPPLTAHRGDGTV